MRRNISIRYRICREATPDNNDIWRRGGKIRRNTNLAPITTPLLFIISTVLNGDDQRVLFTLTRIKRADYSDINSDFSEAGKK